MSWTCILCNKTLCTKYDLIRHYNKKKPCISDIDKWEKNKQLHYTEPKPPKKNEIIPSPHYKRLTFNEEQLNFINSPVKDLKLYGIPGGGKTRIIIEKIKRHLDNSDYTGNNEFLILSYSKRARGDFISKGKIYPKIFNQINVRTLHSLAKIIVDHFNEKHTNSLETLIIVAKKFLQEKNNSEIREIKTLSNIKSIYLDEAQDISKSQFEIIMLLKNKLNCNLVMVGDPNQNIYQFQGGSDRYLLNFEADVFCLKKNYRSTQNIIDFTNSISPNKTNPMVSNITDQNNKVNIVIDSITSIKKSLLDELKNSKYDLSEIAIIGPVKKSKPFGDSYTNLGLSLVQNILAKNNIQYKKFYSDTNDNSTSKFEHCVCKPEPNKVNLFTVHGSKGLEFKKVILLNFHFYTFGRQPTQEDYNRFKYLWYVGVSRAKYDLSIYCLKNKKIWPLLKKVDERIYNCNIQKITYNRINFNNEKEKYNHGITGILESITPEDLYKFEELLNYSYETKKIFEIDETNVVEFTDFRALYGIYIEKIFQYFQSKKKYTLENNIFYKFKSKLLIGLSVDINMVPAVISLIKKLGYNVTDTFNLDMFNKFKNSFSNKDTSTYYYLQDKIRLNNLESFTLIFENDVIRNDQKSIIEICDKMINDYGNNYKENIFKLVLYNYQIEKEAGYLWDKDFSKNIESLDPYIENIEKYVETLEDLETSVVTEHPNLNIIGEIDVLFKNNKISDIKFSKSFNVVHAIQVLLYYNNLFPSWKEKKNLSILNFYQGKEYILKIDDNLTNYDILKLLCDITGEKMKNLCFLYDLETTDLFTHSCKVIERYFYEYNLNFVLSSGVINIHEPINPFITYLTGITNEMIYNGDSFDKFKEEIDELFKYSIDSKFIAHNGNLFDHKILTENQFAGCILKNVKKSDLLDSRWIIRMLTDNDKTKIEEVYNKIIPHEEKSIFNWHRAKTDVDGLYAILKKLNFKI